MSAKLNRPAVRSALPTRTPSQQYGEIVSNSKPITLAKSSLPTKTTTEQFTELIGAAPRVNPPAPINSFGNGRAASSPVENCCIPLGGKRGDDGDDESDSSDILRPVVS